MVLQFLSYEYIVLEFSYELGVFDNIYIKIYLNFMLTHFL